MLHEPSHQMDLKTVHAEVQTAGTTGSHTCDIKKNGTSMLSTLLTIDTTETGSDTAAAAAVIKTDGTEDVATNDVISFSISVIQTTPAKGCVITCEFGLP